MVMKLYIWHAYDKTSLEFAFGVTQVKVTVAKNRNGDMVMKLDIKHAYDKTSLLVLDKDVLNCHLILDT